ncbi:MAG: DNA polymerase III subunit alpha [Coriobacteriaceae bacterium]|jgi:DNA polymerase-3 subunit alpha|nr:DNA polymerase III subunit alpha [Coriobacteriaceae bacterium]
MAFVHLHNHTQYSLLDGATHIEAMVRRAAALGMPAIAITDHGVMSGVPELSEACDTVEKETGIRVKPIFGCEIYFTTDEELKRDAKPKLYHMLLLAKNDTGYHNLIKLVSESQIDNFYYKPRTTFSMLQRYSEGIIATSACLAGIVPRMIDQSRFDEALEWARKLASVYEPGDFYIELQDQGLTTEGGMTQNQLNFELARIAHELGLETVATNDFHYLLQEDARAQDILLCIGTASTMNDPDRMRFTNDQFYMKTEEEMRAALKDFDEACDNTVRIAEKCNVVLNSDPILPRFPLPEGETEESYFRKQCLEGLHHRYGEDLNDEVMTRYEHEADVIIRQGFPAYFLIVQEYIQWAKDNGIGVGPGRGSAAGSIVSYALGITDLDPLSNGLLFERFLSEERVEMPDIDVDFDDERRDDVIAHVKEIYGEDHVASVITFGTLQAKNAIRDAARVLDYPYSVGDRLAKIVGNELGIKLEEAFAKNPDLKKAYDSEPDSKAVLDAALSIEGHVRGEGVHPCATIICRDPLSDHIPMKRDTKGGDIITQYDGHYTPNLGLLKMDFLGLRTLSVISRACKNVKERFGVEIKPEEIPLDDNAAFELMCSGNMDGLFQVESALYVSLFARMKPRHFSDIVASIALNRPGPLESGMVDDFVKCAKGQTQVNYYDDRLRPILEETYGTMVYQEQIMQVSMRMCGFSAGKADKLRKAMGKKNIDIMRQLQEDWNNGAVQNGYSLEVAKRIWEDAEKFAKYAFNKSHSAAYAVIVMRTAYIKAHYPFDYMAAVLSSYMGNADRLMKYIASCNHSGIPVMPPDINTSNLDFTPTEEGIRFGLAGIRGVGEKVAEEVVKERRAGGRFTSLHDYVNRMDSKCYNRKVLDALIKAGAFDSTGYTRKQLMGFIDETQLLEMASKRQRDRDAGQTSMFDLFADEPDSGFGQDIPAPDGIEWEKRVKLAFEKEILKIYVSEHPLQPYESLIARMSPFSLGDLAEREKDIPSGTFVGMVSGVNERFTKLGKKMANFVLEDTTGHIECVCFKFEEAKEVIKEDAIIKVKGKFEHSDRGNQLLVFDAEALELSDADGSGPVHLELKVASAEFNQTASMKLNRILQAHPGRDGVVLFVSQSDGRKFRAELPLTVDARNAALLSEIGDLFGRPVWQAS